MRGRGREKRVRKEDFVHSYIVGARQVPLRKECHCTTSSLFSLHKRNEKVVQLKTSDIDLSKAFDSLLNFSITANSLFSLLNFSNQLYCQIFGTNCFLNRLVGTQWEFRSCDNVTL